MPSILVRVLMFIYIEQVAYVKWGNVKSRMFSITNGTRQGAVVSPIYFSLYLDDLFTELRALGVGCYVGGTWMGAAGYADDIILLAPSRSAMATLLATCEDYAKSHNITFSTDVDPKKSKTKCLHFTLQERIVNPLKLNGDDLPWVKKALHLGNTLTTDISKTLLQ